MELYRVAWEGLPDRTDLGQRGLEIALGAGEYRSALRLIAGLEATAQRKNDVPLEEAVAAFKADALLGYLQSDQARSDYSWDDAAEALKQIILGERAAPRHYAALAEVYRDRNLSESDRFLLFDEADRLMDELVVASADDARAWLARYRYRRRYFDRDAQQAADDDLRQAVELAITAPGGIRIDVLLAAASRRQERNQTDEVIEFLEQAIDLGRSDHRPYEMLASIYKRQRTHQGREQAVTVLREGLVRVGRQELALILPLASTLAEDDRLTEAEAQLKPLRDALEFLGNPEYGIVELGIALIDAQIAVQHGEFDVAINGLSETLDSVEVRLATPHVPSMLGSSWVLLGQLFEQIGAPDRATQAYQTAGRIAPALSDWRLSLARSAMRAGDLDLAISHYRRIVDDQPGFADACLALANAQLQRQIRRGRAQSDWQDVQQAIDKAKDVGASQTLIALLSADIDVAQGNLSQAVKRLESAAENASQDLLLWRGLALSQRRMGNFQNALEAADRYTALATNPVDAASIRAGLLAELGRDNEAVNLLEQLLDAGDSAHKIQASLALAGLQLQLGRRDLAHSVLKQTYSAPDTNWQGKYDVANALALFAWEERAWEELEQYEAWLKEIEGNEEGTLWRFYRAERLLEYAKSVDDNSFKEAVDNAQVLVKLRPAWSRTHVLAGNVALRRGQIDAAIAAYERSWELGGRNILLAENLIALLTQRTRFDEAARYINQVRDLLQQSPQLFDQTIPYYARPDQWQHATQAIELARQWVDETPDDAVAHMRLGRVLVMATRQDAGDESQELLQQAEAEFQRAIELAPEDVQTWVACFAYYSRVQGSTERALETLRKLATQVEVTPIAKAFVLAQLYESIGDPPTARQYYRTAVKLADTIDDPRMTSAVMSRAAQSSRRFEPILAETYCRRALELDSRTALAGQILAELLIRRGDEQALKEALGLLDSQTQLSGQLDVAGRRLRALLIAHPLGGNDTQRAITLTEDSLQKTQDDYRLLAYLYEQNDRLAPAYELLDELASASEPRPQDLVAYLEFWQKHFSIEGKFTRKSQRVYDQLGEMPTGFAERLRLRIEEMKLKYALQTDGRPDFQVVVDELWKTDAITKASDDQARQGLFQQALIVMARHGAMEEAFQLCLEPPIFMPSHLAVRQLCYALILVPPNENLKPEADRIIAEAIATDDDIDLLSSAADYAFMSGGYDTAVERYQKILSMDPSRVHALNNLALAQIEHNRQGEQALAILDRALTLKPGDPGLLDSRAILALSRGEPQLALDVLQQVMEKEPANAVYRLHMAIAYQALGNDAAAKESFLDALSLDLNRQLLSRADRQAVHEMRGNWSL